MKDLQRVNIRIRPEMHSYLKRSAEARGLTMNAMCVFALETYFQQQQLLPHIGDIMKEINKEN